MKLILPVPIMVLCMIFLSFLPLFLSIYNVHYSDVLLPDGTIDNNVKDFKLNCPDCVFGNNFKIQGSGMSIKRNETDIWLSVTKSNININQPQMMVSDLFTTFNNFIMELKYEVTSAEPKVILAIGPQYETVDLVNPCKNYSFLIIQHGDVINSYSKVYSEDQCYISTINSSSGRLKIHLLKTKKDTILATISNYVVFESLSIHSFNENRMMLFPIIYRSDIQQYTSYEGRVFNIYIHEGIANPWDNLSIPEKPKLGPQMQSRTFTLTPSVPIRISNFINVSAITNIYYYHNYMCEFEYISPDAEKCLDLKSLNDEKILPSPFKKFSINCYDPIVITLIKNNECDDLYDREYDLSFNILGVLSGETKPIYSKGITRFEIYDGRPSIVHDTTYQFPGNSEAVMLPFLYINSPFRVKPTQLQILSQPSNSAFRIVKKIGEYKDIPIYTEVTCPILVDLNSNILITHQPTMNVPLNQPLSSSFTKLEIDTGSFPVRVLSDNNVWSSNSTITLKATGWIDIKKTQNMSVYVAQHSRVNIEIDSIPIIVSIVENDGSLKIEPFPSYYKNSNQDFNLNWPKTYPSPHSKIFKRDIGLRTLISPSFGFLRGNPYLSNQVSLKSTDSILDFSNIQNITYVALNDMTYANSLIVDSFTYFIFDKSLGLALSSELEIKVQYMKTAISPRFESPASFTALSINVPVPMKGFYFEEGHGDNYDLFEFELQFNCKCNYISFEIPDDILPIVIPNNSIFSANIFKLRFKGKDMEKILDNIIFKTVLNFFSIINVETTITQYTSYGNVSAVTSFKIYPYSGTNSNNDDEHFGNGDSDGEWINKPKDDLYIEDEDDDDDDFEKVSMSKFSVMDIVIGLILKYVLGPVLGLILFIILCCKCKWYRICFKKKLKDTTLIVDNSSIALAITNMSEALSMMNSQPTPQLTHESFKPKESEVETSLGFEEMRYKRMVLESKLKALEEEYSDLVDQDDLRDIQNEAISITDLDYIDGKYSNISGMLTGWVKPSRSPPTTLSNEDEDLLPMPFLGDTLPVFIETEFNDNHTSVDTNLNDEHQLNNSEITHVSEENIISTGIDNSNLKFSDFTIDKNQNDITEDNSDGSLKQSEKDNISKNPTLFAIRPPRPRYPHKKNTTTPLSFNSEHSFSNVRLISESSNSMPSLPTIHNQTPKKSQKSDDISIGNANHSFTLHTFSSPSINVSDNSSID